MKFFNFGSLSKRWNERLREGHFLKRFFLVVVFLIFLTSFLHLRDVRVDFLQLNTFSDRYVIAQVDFEFPDEEATLNIKQQALRDLGAIYRVSDKKIHQFKQDFEQYLLTHQQWREQLSVVTFDELYRAAEVIEQLFLNVRFVNSRTLQKLQLHHLKAENYFLMLSPKFTAGNLPKEFWDAAHEQMINKEHFHPEAVQFLINNFQKQEWSFEEDFSSGRFLRESIQNKIPLKHTQIQAGTRLIEPNERVGTRHLAMIQAMKDAMAKERNPWTLRSISGNVLLSVFLTFLSIVYFRLYLPQILQSVQKMALLVTIVIVTLMLSKAAEFVLVNRLTFLADMFRYPVIVPFAALLIYVLVGAEVSLFVSAFLTVALGVTLALDHEHFLIVNLIASWVAIILARKMHKRKEIFTVLSKVWLSVVPIIAAFNLSAPSFVPIHLVQDVMSSFVFIFAIALLIIVLLPLFESFFHVLTDMTLMEFMDPNNELIKRLSVEAPGTYQHSLIVGNLAEASAHAINANGLFCRVATLYHDIGKLFNPQYFTENQLGGFNIHQLLTPQESAQVIISHVTEGETLAKKHKLPQNFIQIIREHHGTALVYYFYHKQLERVDNDRTQVDPQLFRYPGPKPHSKESAIIMLADILEAASRSLEHFSEDKIQELVERIVSEQIHDRQLEEAQLTFEELGIVKKTLCQTLFLSAHARVKYPQKQFDPLSVSRAETIS